MKKFYPLILLLLLSFAASAESFTYTYFFKNPEVSNHNGFQLISFENTRQLGITGNPTLPYYPVKLLLPPGQSVASVEIIRQNYTALEGEFELWPYQPSRPLSETGKIEFIKNEQLYSSQNEYPTEAGRELSTHFMNGYGFAIGAITPLSMIPASGEVGYYHEITVVVHTTSDRQAAASLNMLIDSDKFKAQAEKFADNPKAIDQYKPEKNRDTSDYNMLIITPEQFVAGFDQLRNVYLERGVKSEIATKEFVIQNITGNDVQEKIRNYIIEQYQNNGIEFVLLGGDTEFIPHRGFYCYVESGGGYSDSGIPADLYYSALDGTWDANMNNLWGEPDEDDLLPDVAVGRLPFSTPAELENIVHKSIYYQNYPVTGELTNALMAGEHLYSDPETYGSDYLELLIGTHNDNGYTTVGIPEEYNFEKLYEVNQSWSKYDLMDAINSGQQMVHHVGHAAQTYVAYMTNSDITNANFAGANGTDHNYTLLQTHGCDCGAFDVNDCVLEKMVTIENFAVAVMGNSRFGWFNEGQTEGPAAHLHREMMDALYGEEIRFLGKAFAESKIQTAPWVEATGQWEEGALRWNFYDLNLLGDPGVSVWTNEPINIEVDFEDELVLSTTSTIVTVNSSGAVLENFTCSIIKEGVLLGTATTNANGIATITFTEEIIQPGIANLIINGRNCLPTSFDIQFIPDNGAYVVFSSYQINDETGNNNQLADYGEAFMLTITIGNVGLGACENLNVTLSTADEYITITDDFELYGTIAPSGLVTIENAFGLEVSDSIPDLHMAPFTLYCESGTLQWESTFGMELLAPVLKTGDCLVLDNIGGNGNLALDPGETDTLRIEGLNTGHSDAFGTQISLTTQSQYATLNTNVIYLENLPVGENKPAFFEVEIHENAPIGTVVELACVIRSGFYQHETTYYLPVGLVIEDFESGDFSRFEWQAGGNQPWTVTNTNPFDGEFSAKSGNIDHYQKSELLIQIEVYTGDELSFYRKVSSEEGYDYLSFYLDDAKLGEWAGVLDWEQQTYPLASGTHWLKWAYEKDISATGGEDAAWLDNIVFPANTTILSVNESVLSNQFSIFPNPANHEVTVALDNERISEVSFYNITGHKVPAITTAQSDTQLKFDVSELNAGIYFIEVSTSSTKLFKKLIIK